MPSGEKRPGNGGFQPPTQPTQRSRQMLRLRCDWTVGGWKTTAPWAVLAPHRNCGHRDRVRTHYWVQRMTGFVLSALALGMTRLLKISTLSSFSVNPPQTGVYSETPICPPYATTVPVCLAARFSPDRPRRDFGSRFLRFSRARPPRRIPRRLDRRTSIASLIWMDGGPSHYETFDPRPDARQHGAGPSIPSPLACRACAFLPRRCRNWPRLSTSSR